MSAKFLGMGSTETWHGTPDARVRGSNLVLPQNGDDDEDNIVILIPMEKLQRLKL